MMCFVLDTKNLQERETWNIDTDDERGGTTTLVISMLVYMTSAV